MSEENQKASTVPADTAGTKKSKPVKAAAGVTAKPETYMYLGPNLPEGVLFTGRVYKGKSGHIKNILEKAPELESFFIEIKRVPAFKSELSRQGSEAHRKYQNIEAMIREGAFKNGV